MNNIIIELSKYFMIICMAFFTLHGFIVFRYSDHEDQRSFYLMQNVFMVMIHACGYAVLILEGGDYSLAVFYCVCQVAIVAYIILYRALYPASSPLIINNMCMLLTVSLIIMARLSYTKCQKQFIIVAAGMVISLIIPVLIKMIKPFFKIFTLVFGFAGLFILALVLVLGSVTYGSKLSFTVNGLTFQPSEAVKLIFVFFLAGMLSKAVTLRSVILTSAFAFAHIIILTLSKDLGSALIFFVVFVLMLFAATGNIGVPLLGLAGGSGAAVLGYKLFSHVRTRVIAWKDPFSVIDGQGYQITQSLFAIGTGGWFGMGLGQGAPGKIPVVEADFIFSAICEELGVLFGLCLILICVSNFLMFINIAIKIKDDFYKLSALGFGIIYGFQIFLTIGGVTRFIPLTGVTLPLVSYGGTSVIVSFVMFSIVQGIYTVNSGGK